MFNVRIVYITVLQPSDVASFQVVKYQFTDGLVSNASTV